jgi:hypothetical protein
MHAVLHTAYLAHAIVAAVLLAGCLSNELGEGRSRPVSKLLADASRLERSTCYVSAADKYAEVLRLVESDERNCQLVKTIRLRRAHCYFLKAKIDFRNGALEEAQKHAKYALSQGCEHASGLLKKIAQQL